MVTQYTSYDSLDLDQTLSAGGGPLLQLPTAQAGWYNIPNQIHQGVITISDKMGHAVSFL